MEKITIIASKKNWIDSRSVDTLKQIGDYKGVQKVVGLPDLGIGTVPNGMAVLTKNRIYPHLIGGDIGCGMSLYETALNSTHKKSIKVERFEKKLNKLESLDHITLDKEIELAYSLGSIGKGNHFAELHLIHEVQDEKLFKQLDLSSDSLYTLVHSGSRSFGQIVFDTIAGSYDPTEGIDVESSEAKVYLDKHNQAISYAHQSRTIIASKLLKAIGINRVCKCVSDTAHNSIMSLDEGWLHRKGATPTDKGPVIIAGSRGSLSYLVMPTEHTFRSNFSLAHGSGRKWERGSAKSKLQNRYSHSDLLRTAIGSRVICKDKKLLYDESPQAYKNIDIVIDDLVNAGLATVIATFKPILTYKE